MIDEATAAGLAQAFLKKHAGKPDLDLVVTGPPFEMSDGYIVGYQTRRFVETGDMNNMMVGSMPIFVDRLTGEASYCTPKRYDELVRTQAEARRRG